MALKMLDAVAIDGVSLTFERVDYSPEGQYGSHVVSGLVKYKKTNTGTCVVSLKDGETAAVITSLTVGAGNPAAAAIEVAVPDTFYAEITGSSGTYAIDVWMDGL